MSYRIRQSVVSSLFGSNHFVIAACAAIAMVLGAMSVGASISDTGESPQQANISTTNDSANGSSRLPRSDEKMSNLTPQHTLEPRAIVQPVKTPDKLKSTAKAQYQLNELLTPVASSLFVDQTLLLNELQARASTGTPPSSNESASDGSAPTTGSETSSTPSPTNTPPSGSTDPSPAEPTQPPENPTEGNPSVFSGASQDPIPPAPTP